jgi:hypothetical protein
LLEAAAVLVPDADAALAVVAVVVPVAAVVAAEVVVAAAEVVVAAAAAVAPESASASAVVVVAVAVVVGMLVVVTGVGGATVELPLLDWAAWCKAENKSCRKACKSCGKELVVPELVEPVAELLPVVLVPVLEAVPIGAELPSVVPVAAVLPLAATVVAALELAPLAGLLWTYCVSAVSKALNRLPPPCVELVLLPVEPESEPPSRCRLPEAR